jgi:hypothetical protein
VKSYIIKNKDIKIKFFEQPENMGLEKNAVFVLSKSKARFVMYLGDDDYLRSGYLKAVIEEIKNNNNITCIVPSILGVKKSNGSTVGGRDIGKPTMRYKRGFRSVMALMDKGHQLSGVIFLRKGTLEAYKKGGLANIYPFIFFVGFNCMRGNSVHLTGYPVNVTEGGKKDWGYGNDGLLKDIFDNTYMLFKNNPFLRSIEELVILRKHSWRYMMYFGKGLKAGLLTYFRIMKLGNLTIQTKFAFTILYWVRLFKRLPIKIFSLLFR